MPFTKKNVPQLINSSSMADVAFLLLIFFLITTQITEEQGVLVKLPCWDDQPVAPAKVADRNIFSVLVNANNKILVEGDLTALLAIRSKLKAFILNSERRDDWPDISAYTMVEAILVTLKNDRGTTYSVYLEVYDALIATYRELRDDYAQRNYQRSYGALMQHQRDEVNAYLPMVISEAETDFVTK